MLEIRSCKGHLIWGTGPALRIAAVASVGAIAALRYRSFLLPMTRIEAIQAAEYAFIILASIALIAAYAGFAERLRLHRFLGLPWLIIPAAALLAAGVYKLGMHQFGGWDEGLLVHAATYYAQGFRPILDFPCAMPPLFMTGARCIALLGLKWTSFTMLAAVFTALTTLWMFVLLRAAGLPRHWGLVVTLCAEASTMLVTPFWWFNNSSAVSVVLLFLSVLSCLQLPRRVLPWMSVSLSLAMVVASKPNDLPAALLMLVLLATKDRWQWVKTLLACAGALGIFLLICRAAQMPLLQLLHSYAEIGKLRGSPLQLLPLTELPWPERDFQIIFILAAVLCFSAIFVVSVKHKPSHWPILGACAIAGLTAIEMTCTNSEIKTSDLCVMLAASAILCLRPWETQEVSARRKTLLAGWLSVFLVMSVFFAVIHVRILLIGEGAFFEPFPTATIDGGFFSGLEAGPRLQSVLQQTSHALSSYPSQKVFFGPRMEVMYAEFNRSVTPEMPLLWDPGNLYSPARLPRLLLAFQQDDPDLLIFLKEDFTRMGLVAFYIRNTATYQRIDTYRELTVYVRKREVPITYIRVPEPSLAPPQ